MLKPKHIIWAVLSLVASISYATESPLATAGTNNTVQPTMSLQEEMSNMQKMMQQHMMSAMTPQEKEAMMKEMMPKCMEIMQKMAQNIDNLNGQVKNLTDRQAVMEKRMDTMQSTMKH